MSERPCRVVLVEDNDDDADLVARGAKRFGSRVELVRLQTIPAAIELLKEDRVSGVETDLVLIDGKIGSLDAHVFFERARSEDLLSVSCVVLKGCVDSRVDSELLHLGARQVRSKPVDYERFQEQIAEILVSFCPRLGGSAVSVGPDQKNS